jgi:putative DNA primase/helicase
MADAPNDDGMSIDEMVAEAIRKVNWSNRSKQQSPSADDGWRPVMDGELFPPGRNFRMNQTTGVNEVYEPSGDLPDDPPATTQSSPRSRRAAQPTAPAFDDAPVIQCRAGELHIQTTLAEDALIASGLPIYQRGDVLVQPVVREVTASYGRTTLAAGLGELTPHSLLDHMCASATYQRYDARAKDWVAINPPPMIANILLSRKGRWNFQPIAGIITCPTLRPDGTVLTEAGYDPATRLYHVKDASLDILLPSNPTKEDARQALQKLLGLLTEFPFVSDVDRSVGLSGIMTPVVRGAISVAPLHAAKASTPGTGKSFWVDIVSVISTGRLCPVASAAADDIAETEKRLVGLLLGAYPIISIDNCNGELGGDLLCQATERPILRIRRLGSSEILEIENRAGLYATGNGLRVSGDLVRRNICAALDANMERPETRQFKRNPLAEIQANRGMFISACLTVALAYRAAGYPDKLPVLASFDDRSALVWLGQADPCKSMEQARDQDPELTTLREMLGLWEETVGLGLSYCETGRRVAEKSSERTTQGRFQDQSGPLLYPDFRDALLRVAGARGMVDTRKLGNWLRAHEGRIVDERMFKRGAPDTDAKVERWTVVDATNPKRQIAPWIIPPLPTGQTDVPPDDGVPW